MRELQLRFLYVGFGLLLGISCERLRQPPPSTDAHPPRPARPADARADDDGAGIERYRAYVRATLADARVKERAPAAVAELRAGKAGSADVRERAGMPGPMTTDAALARWKASSYLDTLGLDVRWVVEQHHLQCEPRARGGARARALARR